MWRDSQSYLPACGKEQLACEIHTSQRHQLTVNHSTAGTGLRTWDWQFGIDKPKHRHTCSCIIRLGVAAGDSASDVLTMHLTARLHAYFWAVTHAVLLLFTWAICSGVGVTANMMPPPKVGHIMP
jgi:hypothetical protein